MSGLLQELRERGDVVTLEAFIEACSNNNQKLEAVESSLLRVVQS